MKREYLTFLAGFIDRPPTLLYRQRVKVWIIVVIISVITVNTVISPIIITSGSTI